jgi:catechol 2,3-dioxygenase-like lactoylglutathione lyase family enzyme
MAVVRYLVVDVDAAVAFYTGVLGFDLVEQWGPPFAMVRRDDLMLWLSGPGSSAARPLADGARPVPGGWNRVVLETNDIASHIARLTKAGATLRNDIVAGPGGKQALILDPSGNPIELFEPGKE